MVSAATLNVTVLHGGSGLCWNRIFLYEEDYCDFLNPKKKGKSLAVSS